VQNLEEHYFGIKEGNGWPSVIKEVLENEPVLLAFGYLVKQLQDTKFDEQTVKLGEYFLHD